jgi:hypothetical protein
VKYKLYYFQDEIKHLLGITAPKLIFCDDENYLNVKECLTELNLDTIVITLGSSFPSAQNIDSILKATGEESLFE